MVHARSWHPSGRFLAFSSNDVMILPMEGDATRGWTPGTPAASFATPGVAEWHPMFSPDGRFVAYASSEAAGGAARLEDLDIYVRSFPGPGGKWRISTEGGTWPTWSATSRELLFVLNSTRTIMVAAYTVVGDSFKADTPQPWSPTGYQSLGSPVVSGPYALHPDGKRVALAAARDSVAEVHDQVVFISNFFDYLRKIAPLK
jgi:Tol biopolymer transport system component